MFFHYVTAVIRVVMFQSYPKLVQDPNQKEQELGDDYRLEKMNEYNEMKERQDRHEVKLGDAGAEIKELKERQDWHKDKLGDAGTEIKELKERQDWHEAMLSKMADVGKFTLESSEKQMIQNKEVIFTR